jgi:hypothetical protein
MATRLMAVSKRTIAVATGLATGILCLVYVGVTAAQPPAGPVGAGGAPGASGASGGRGRGGGLIRQPDPIDFGDHTGWSELFDGKTLDGWDGDPDVWRVENGTLVGEYTSPLGTRNGETFIIWKGGEPENFELKLEIKLEGPTADSGIQYRSYLAPIVQGRGGGAGGTGGQGQGAPALPTNPPNPKWSLGGYQFDFNFANNYTGQVVDGGRGSRGIVAFRGQMVRTEQGKNPRLLSTLGTLEELGGIVKINDWNQVHLIARGNTLIQTINGHVMAILIDDDPTKARAKGLIGLQCSGNGTLKISFRGIWLKNL